MLKSIIAALALIASLLFAPAIRAGDPVIGFKKQDPVMQGAIKQAQDTLPRFLSIATLADNSLHPASMLKVSVPVADGNITHEIIWVDTITRKDDTFLGHLANEPNHMPELTQGSQISFEANAIFDWSIWGEEEKLYGNFTTRVMLPHIDAATAQHFKTILSEVPAPW